MKIKNDISKAFCPSKGLHKGCSLSPLFQIIATLYNWRKRIKGMEIPTGCENLYTISYANDQVVIAQDSFDLEFMLRKCYENWGMKININKTKYLTINNHNGNTSGIHKRELAEHL